MHQLTLIRLRKNGCRFDIIDFTVGKWRKKKGRICPFKQDEGNRDGQTFRFASQFFFKFGSRAG